MNPEDYHRQKKLLQQTDGYADLMDRSIRLPGGFRIGLDGLIGLIPGVGDAVGAGLAIFPIIQARRAGISGWPILKMCSNVLLESTVGIIPVIGDLFDFWFKANVRNAAILRDHLTQRMNSEPNIQNS